MTIDLSTLPWSLSGWRPYAWRHARSVETSFWLEADIAAMPAHLPGSVQRNLLENGIIPDWNIAFGSREIEWVEHRHWVFTVTLDDAASAALRSGDWFLEAESLDYSGWILVNGTVAGTFRGPHQPTVTDLSQALARGGTGPITLGIVFDSPPEVHGQVGYTSRTTDLKPRYNYSWDWCPRLVPIGARGSLRLVPADERRVRLVSVCPTVAPDLEIGAVEVILEVDAEASAGATAAVAVCGCRAEFALHAGKNVLRVSVPHPSLWWPRGAGPQQLHTLVVEVRTGAGRPAGRFERRIGFKHVEWRANEGAPDGAHPWQCVVNRRPLFMQGVNWTPARLDYQDTTDAEYDQLTGLYAEMGCNLLRVWGGAFLESEVFYRLCDERGLLVWQEFPLSSSGLDNQPPHDPRVIAELCDVARHFIRSRRHHASLLCWCGGNELQTGLEHEKHLGSRPCDAGDPCLAALGRVVSGEDPGRRFVATSPTGPKFYARVEDFGKGLHHHVHGPWGFGDFPTYADWVDYWERDDSTLRSEVGVASMNSMELLEWHAAGNPLWPTTTPIWKHSSGWWTQKERMDRIFGAVPADLALREASAFTREEQARALAHAARCSKRRFPRCGGFIVWMGHDCFPCPANTSIIDFKREPKPAWHALREVFLEPVPSP